MNFFELLKEKGIVFLFFLVIILIFIFFVYFQKIYRKELELKKLIQEQKKREKKNKEKSKKIELANNQLLINIEKLKSTEEKLYQEEKRINNLADQLFRKEELFLKQVTAISQKEKKVDEGLREIKETEAKVINELGKIIPMSGAEAKKMLFSLLRKEVDHDLNVYKEQKIKQLEKEVEAKSTNIICLALEKYSSELVFARTTNTLQLENRQMISKIIGKEGRNINAFRRITGTEVLIDKEEDDMTIKISSFNSLRREVALQTLQTLIREERISPAQIEKAYQKVSSEINELIVKSGEKVLKELEIAEVHPEMIKCLGKLKYRTSYGQNVLEHSLEVAKIAGDIAAELNLDVLLARRAGLFHDIGKSVEDISGYSHVLSGISLAKKYKEPEVVVNAIASHHRDVPADNFYSLIILAADKLSAARPGARGYQLETYIERMKSLESIANEFPGIKKSYAFQAGREIWVIADAEKLSDYRSWETSKKIKERIKAKNIIPGEVTIYVVREKRFVQKLNSGELKQSSNSLEHVLIKKQAKKTKNHERNNKRHKW